MARKDVTDAQVVAAYEAPRAAGSFVDQVLMEATGQPRKVCLAAMERAWRRGLVDYGVSLRSGWVNPAAPP